MAVTTSEKDFSCSNCGNLDPQDSYCRALSPAHQNPQQDPGAEFNTIIEPADTIFRWCGHWKRAIQVESV